MVGMCKHDWFDSSPSHRGTEVFFFSHLSHIVEYHFRCGFQFPTIVLNSGLSIFGGDGRPPEKETGVADWNESYLFSENFVPVESRFREGPK
jgi:hypothetical protein